jgi:hypothetical protein
MNAVFACPGNLVLYPSPAPRWQAGAGERTGPSRVKLADVRTDGLDKQPPPMVYVPYWDQIYWLGKPVANISYILRTSQDPSQMGKEFLSTLRGVDPELPLTRVRTMRNIMFAQPWVPTNRI